MSLGSTLYNALFKRTSTFALVMMTSAFFVERGIDATTDYLFDRINEGKLWHHVKPQE